MGCRRVCCCVGSESSSTKTSCVSHVSSAVTADAYRRPPPHDDAHPAVPPPPRPRRRAPSPPPGADAATASIEHVIGRLRLASASGDQRRVPRMGTRLSTTDVTSSSSRFNEPLPPPPGPERDGDAAAVRAVDASDGRGVSRSTQTDSMTSSSYRLCAADVMYTNRANLRPTIAVQQRLFRQQLADRQSSSAPPRPPAATDPRPGPVTADARPRGSGKQEWIVRRRSDGSRYVTRRPVRCKTATWVGCETTTTDDDDASQPPARTGRYWTRDERRQHVAERRHRLQAVKSRCPGQLHGLAAELAAISRHHQRQTPQQLLSVATV